MSISLARVPMGHPEMQSFVSQLSHVNGLADCAPGFVWRLTTEEGNSTGVRGFENPLIYLNMSLWESIDALFDFVYKSPHVVPFRDRRQWFEPMDGPATVLWWVPQGHLPTVREGRERLELLARVGPTVDGFDFRHRFPAPGATEPTSPVSASIAGEMGK
ncbi:MAG TPA: DUF3291 domain-containing protein [Polyangiaceae bacterium]|nr:DUF3291 domain-containing protein [Polyangiaceae bacterium]